MSEVVGPGTVLSGRYRVLEPGASDVPGLSVWQATDQILDRPVRALVLSGRLPAATVSAALDGARRAALVSDPRLVRVLDVGTHEGHGYVVTEDVTGPTLAELVERSPLTADQARAIVGEAAGALEVARRRGLHHLALRPRTLRLVGPGRVLVTGLGVDSAVMGAASGDARETSRRDSVDLVRLLYTALTGRWPASSSDAIAPGLPTAPVANGLATPPADLVGSVPNDLDTLCTVTLGPHDDGPHTPGDLVRELEPWGAIRTAETPAGAGDGERTEVIRAATPEDDLQDTAPIRVPRQSVRSAFGDEPTAGVNRPGTPPPAAPLRTSAFGGPATAPPVGSVPTRIPRSPEATTPLPVGDDAPTPPTGQPAVAPPSVAPGAFAHPTVASWDRSGPSGADPASDDAFGSVIGAGSEPPRRRAFDPTALVLTVVGIAVVIGVVLAFKALFSSLDTGAPEPRPSATATQDSSGQSPDPSDEPSGEPTDDESTPPSSEPPVIASATSVDPSDDDGEHEEAVARAFDGDTSTYWYTMTYQQPNFSGFKDGVGFVMTLARPAVVSSVTLQAGSTGGRFEVRTGGADDPSGGELLGSGSFGPDVTVDLDQPTETGTVTLWITELPTAADGSFRLELNEISLG